MEQAERAGGTGGTGAYMGGMGKRDGHRACRREGMLWAGRAQGGTSAGGVRGGCGQVWAGKKRYLDLGQIQRQRDGNRYGFEEIPA